ncbi:MAG: hypothetical protein WAW52_01160 [Methanothrix sp.]
MPREEYRNRYASVYFGTQEEKLFWEKFAQERGTTLSNLIFEGLSSLRGKETAKPRPDLIKENEAQRDELRQVRSELKLKSELLRRYEDEIYKFRFANFDSVDPQSGSRRFDVELIKLLKDKNRTFNSSDILDALGIDSHDIQSVKLVRNQLESLLRFGLVTENSSGWRWSK